ncbi:MAG TPA: hypothetical protein VIS06_21190, partial [Mycobacteriales bacterium]
MIDDLVGRLAAQGIDTPALEPLPLAVGVTVMGFPSEGDAALAWWRRLRAVHELTGFWPVLVPSVDEAVDASGKVEAGPGERLARAVEMDGAEVLNPQGATFESLDDQRRQDMLEKWPEAPGRIDGFGLPYLRNGQPAPVLVALVAAESGWQVPTLLDYG